MRTSILVLVHLSVWGLIGAAMFGADPEKPRAQSQKIAGEFSLGDGKGYNASLNLHQNGTFEYRAWGCIGDHAKGEGVFQVKNDLLILEYKTLLPKPEFPPREGGYHAVAHVVAWSDRLYLIPKEDMIDFCNSINEGAEPRHHRRGFHFLLEDDWKKPAAGSPSLPKEWMKYLLDKPVSGSIVELVGKEKAWLDQGSAAGLMPGMTLHSRGNSFYKLQIEKVEQNKSLALKLYESGFMKVGDSVTSKWRD